MENTTVKIINKKIYLSNTNNRIRVRVRLIPCFAFNIWTLKKVGTSSLKILFQLNYSENRSSFHYLMSRKSFSSQWIIIFRVGIQYFTCDRDGVDVSELPKMWQNTIITIYRTINNHHETLWAMGFFFKNQYDFKRSAEGTGVPQWLLTHVVFDRRGVKCHGSLYKNRTSVPLLRLAFNRIAKSVLNSQRRSSFRIFFSHFHRSI